MKIPHTQNETYGFYGTCAIVGLNAQSLWDIAIQQIHQATQEHLEDIAIFLDSRHGRHFADDVVCLIRNDKTAHTAIYETVQKWQTWQLGSAVKGMGLPTNTPYLNGLIMMLSVDLMI
ncbi:hypothetical protein MIS45_11270 [Wielerella bovis]|uniref:hypothetical protein n=1 Tax=Wielerella bovis TaxID=2917790 RepID=UPI002019E942|nr:hypothetical protein [Wielerella bovis]ULJ69300.1 hypothetical protein MIS45_11270 [Wielerella bovis]